MDAPMTPTPALKDFLTEYEADDNLWWRVGCGAHLNLFEEAVERIEDLEAELAALKALLPSPATLRAGASLIQDELPARADEFRKLAQHLSD